MSSSDDSSDDEMDQSVDEDDLIEQQIIERENAESDKDESEKEEESEAEVPESVNANEVEEEVEDNTNKEPSDDEKSGWADAMAKVLRTGKDSEKILLSKAKKDYEQSKTTTTTTGATDDSQTDEKSKTKKLQPNLSAAKSRLKRKELDLMCRVKPTPLDRNRERTLTKLATKGVVQLFNAVRDQQKNIKTQLDQVGKSTRKREKIFQSLDKEGFMNSKKTKVGITQKLSETKTEPEVKVEDDTETWSVLKDNFMLGAKMKDWDKDEDSD